MLCPERFSKFLEDKDLKYYNGVPDSFLAPLLKALPNKKVSPNEGSAIAHGAGYHLATGKIPIIYMQNSGLGNAINPLTSLANKNTYAIPMLLIIGWRGSNDINDEPQHQTMGENLEIFLKAANIEFEILSLEENIAKEQLTRLLTQAKKTSSPIALLVKKNSFASKNDDQLESNGNKLFRKDVIESILKQISAKDKILATTGHTSRELMSLIKKMESSFFNIGAMGHLSQIALGLVESSEKHFICLDGEGSLIMHLGNLIPLIESSPKNLTYIVFNNFCHLSVGGQETAWRNKKVSDYFSHFTLIKDVNDLQLLETHFKEKKQGGFFEILVSNNKEKNLPRPTLSPKELKDLFIKDLH